LDPDQPFITGLIYLGWYLMDRIDGRALRFFEKGYHFHLNDKIPGGLIRDPKMTTGKPSNKMWNRDQWLIMSPAAFGGGLPHREFTKWRKYAKFRPRHWLMPNHALHFARVENDAGWLLTWAGDLAEYIGIKSHKPGDEDTTIHMVVRLTWAILDGHINKQVVKNWRKLNHRVDVRAEFKHYATRPIPGDPPGEHPRFDLIWQDVIDKVWIRVREWEADPEK